MNRTIEEWRAALSDDNKVSVVSDESNHSDSADWQRLETVLIIEDDQEVSYALAKRLRNAGLEVQCVPDGAEGLQAVERGARRRPPRGSTRIWSCSTWASREWTAASSCTFCGRHPA